MVNERRIEILSGAVRLDTEKIMTRVRADLKKYVSKDAIHIASGVGNTIRDELVSVPNTWNRGKSDADYETLLSGKVKDKFMKTQIKRHWEITGQLRTINRMTLTASKGNHPKISVLQTAPEHRYSFANWWIGQNIDSNNFVDKVKAFTDKMRSVHGIRGTTIDSFPSQPCTILSVVNEVTLH